MNKTADEILEGIFEKTDVQEFQDDVYRAIVTITFDVMLRYKYLSRGELITGIKTALDDVYRDVVNKLINDVK